MRCPILLAASAVVIDSPRLRFRLFKRGVSGLSFGVVSTLGWRSCFITESDAEKMAASSDVFFVFRPIFSEGLELPSRVFTVLIAVNVVSERRPPSLRSELTST